MSLVETPPEAVTRRPRVPWLVAFLTRRAFWALITLVVYLIIVFVLVQVLVPFNFATPARMGGPDAYRAALAQLGLDRPLAERLFEYVGGLVTFDLGDSFTGQPVAAIIAETLPVTIFVFAVGALLAFVVGEMMGQIDGIGLGGKSYGKFSGFCTEDQAFPDAVNHPHFPNVIITPDKPYSHWCEIEIA